MSILQTSMSHISDPPKIVYTDARAEDAYYPCASRLRVKLKSQTEISPADRIASL